MVTELITELEIETELVIEILTLVETIEFEMERQKRIIQTNEVGTVTEIEMEIDEVEADDEVELLKK
ncbi:MAG: hypothetical protein LBF15_05995 [Candidatus Peribacteria bacterium]|jgi:hypothetical protein|nr:hypothetical protein [Candidatus Peribacteria bacterium]